MLHAQLWQVIVLISALLFGVVANLSLVWRQQRVRLFKEQGAAAEEALQLERLNLNAIFESSPVAMLILDEAANIVRLNTAALVLTGGSTADVRSRRPGNALSCVHCAKDPRGCGYSTECPFCRLRNRIEALIANGGSIHGAELMMELMRNGGPQKVWMRIGAETIRINGRRHVCLSMEDVTERTLAMETLRESERRLSTLLANLPGMAYRCQNLPDWPMIFVSEGCAALTGWSAADLVQNSPAYGELIVPSDREQVWNAVQAAHGTRQSFELTYQIHAADGRIKWVWERGNGVFGEDGGLLFLEGFIADITERKRAEEALRATEERFHRAVVESPFPVILHAEDGQILQVSNSWCDITGYTREELTTIEDWTERAYGAKKSQVQADIDGLFDENHRVALGEYVIRIKSGGTRIWDFSSAPLGHLPDGRRLVISMAMDVTERKLAAEALRESEEKLKEANKIAKLGNWELNLANSQLKWSDGIFEIFEIDEAGFEATYEAFLKAIHPDDREWVNMAYTESHANKTPYEISHRLLMPDGRIKWVVEICRTDYDEQGVPYRSFGIVQDITERKRAEVELAETQALLQAALDCSTAGIAIADAPSGQLRYVNQAGLLIRGSSEAEVVAGVDVNQYVASWKLLDLDGRPLAMEEVPLARAVLFGERSTREFIIRRSASEDRVVLANAAPILNPAGQTIAGIVVFLDITERRQAEEWVKTSLLEKESLLKEIHHRVKNNLQIISSLLRLQSDKIDNPVARAALRDMQNRVHSMALVHESLYGSEIFASVDLAAYLRQLCHQLCRALVATPGRIRLHMDMAPVRLNIDQAIPCGLLVNELVSNAFKHAFPEDRSGELRVELQAPANGRGCLLRVSDDGVGLPPDLDLEHLGSLGLKLVTDLVRQIGGRLEIGPGPGAVFEIEFVVS